MRFGNFGFGVGFSLYKPFFIDIYRKIRYKNNMYVVYQITHRVSKKYYIGKTTIERWQNGYMGSGKWIMRAVKAHGKDAFYRAVLYSFDNEEDAFKKEGECVNHECEYSYNLRKGGAGGYPQSAETREKIGHANKGNQWNLGKTRPPEVCEKIRLARLGKKFSKKSRKKMSVSSKKAWARKKRDANQHCFILA